MVGDEYVTFTDLLRRELGPYAKHFTLHLQRSPTYDSVSVTLMELPPSTKYCTADVYPYRALQGPLNSFGQALYDMLVEALAEMLDLLIAPTFRIATRGIQRLVPHTMLHRTPRSFRRLHA